MIQECLYSDRIYKFFGSASFTAVAKQELIGIIRIIKVKFAYQLADTTVLGNAVKIRGNRVPDLKIQSSAYRQAEEFYEFSRTMASYPETIGKTAVLALSADCDLFKYHKGMSANK